jgi:hypothetical protein
MHTACVWSVKLPFAEYSVVKEPVDSQQSTVDSQYLLNPRRPLTVDALLTPVDCQLSTVDSSGGEYRARTGDLLVANQALSQLS